MELIDLIGHVLYALLFGGQILVSRKIAAGWILRLIYTIGWTVIGFIIGMTSIVIWCALFAVLDSYGYYTWKKEEGQNA